MKILIVFLIFSAFISGCQSKKEGFVSSDKKIEKVRHCIGRSVADIPASLVVSPMAWGAFKEKGLGHQDSTIDLIISTSEITVPIYLAKTKQREHEIREMADDDIKVLRTVRKISENVTIFRIQEIDDAYTSEVSALINGAMVTARLDSYRNQFEQAEDRLISLLSRLKGRDAVAAENFRGFCLGRLVLSGDFVTEMTRYSFSDKKGMRVSFDVNTYTPNEHVDLLSRVSGSKSILTIFNVDHTVLRARELNVAGMKAQEWLSWAILQDDSNVRTHTFELETMRSMPGKPRPRISVTLQTAQPQGNGVYAKTSASDEETIKLWDSIVTSIQALGVES